MQLPISDTHTFVGESNVKRHSAGWHIRRCDAVYFGSQIPTFFLICCRQQVPRKGRYADMRPLTTGIRS